MAAIALRPEERTGLILAAVAHAALVAFLVWRPIGKPVVLPPERMTVTIADELGPKSTSPDPSAQAAPDTGPEIGEPAPPVPEPEPEPIVRPEPPKPQPPKPPPPKPIARPAPSRPQPRVIPPPPRPVPPRPQVQRPKPAAQAPRTRPALTLPPKKAGATGFSNAFSNGVPGVTTPGKSQNQAAAAPSAQLVSSWASSIGSRVRRPWDACAPSGAEAEQLRIMVRFTLDRSGGVAGMDEPVVSGANDANRAQVERYKECAIRAIRASAPFPGLPPEYYDFWKSRRLNFRKE